VLFGKYLGTEVVAATLANAGPHVYTSVTRDEKQRKLFIKVVNASSDAAPLAIALHGAANVSKQATLITLSGKSPNATNSLTDPNAVAPVERKIQVAGPNFEHSFVPYSINVLELNY
jgi:alpha-N-arabinofuranosidase